MPLEWSAADRIWSVYSRLTGLFLPIQPETFQSYRFPADSHSHRPGVKAFQVSTEQQEIKLHAGVAPIYLDMV